MSDVTVVGAGSWGTAVSNLLAKKGCDVILWGRDGGVVSRINDDRRNPRYLDDVEINQRVRATDDLASAIAGASIVAWAVPSHAMRGIIDKVASQIAPGTILVSLTKGLEPETGLRMTDIFSEAAPQAAAAVLSGPNHAEEVSRDIPSATVVATSRSEQAILLQDLFTTPVFRVYRNDDVLGVELGAAVKNVIAIAAGASDGLGYGDNAKASLITRGLAEMTRLGVALGARAETFSGVAGIGDLIATCTSRHSRNRAVGERLAQGKTAVEAEAGLGMIAEGVKTAPAVCKLADQARVEMPICTSVADVIYKGKDVEKCVKELMRRKHATEGL